MIVIKATCNLCNQDCEVMNFEMHLTVFNHGRGHFYEFLCKNCYQASRSYCDDFIVQLLVEQGRVNATFVDVAPEFLEEKTGAPLTMDDLLDLHNELERL